MKKYLNLFFSTRMSGIYLLLFAIAIGVATFIENDYGTSAAQKLIFKARWFEGILVLFGLSILINIFRFRMLQQKKWPVLLFHLAILIILAGAAVTRYTGSEGRMHIREGNTSNVIISDKTYLSLEYRTDKKKYRINEEVLFASLGQNQFSQDYQIGNQLFGIKLLEFIPNPVVELAELKGGVPIIKIVLAGDQGREEAILKQTEVKNLRGIWFNFDEIEKPEAVNIIYQDGHLLFKVPFEMVQTVMATQQKDTIFPGKFHPLLTRSLYANELINFVIVEFKEEGEIIQHSSSPKMTNESTAALRLEVTTAQQKQTVVVEGTKGVPGHPQTILIGNHSLSIAYGAILETLPFSLKLHDFAMERYPGTNSASSYSSEVTLVDNQNNTSFEHRIYMNHILNYAGYRFFQSSYDQDELGTVLSVNQDAWGTWVTYAGYILLTLGMIWTFFAKNSRFHKVSILLNQSRSAKAGVALLILGLFTWPGFVVSAKAAGIPNVPEINSKHADRFGRLIVQDHRGRMKPMSSLAGEVLRKLTRKETLFGQSAEQIFVGMTAFPDQWAEVPMIRIGIHDEVRKLLDPGGSKKLLSYNDFFNPEYILSDYVREAFNHDSRDRSVFDKEIIKLDERINICNLIYRGSLAKLFPVEDDPGQTWEAPGHHVHNQSLNTSFAKEFYAAYLTAVRTASASGQWAKADEFIQQLTQLQKEKSSAIIPSENKIKVEVLLEKSNVFGRIAIIYTLLGLLLLILFFVSVFSTRFNTAFWLKLALFGLGVTFLGHTLGLATRWYVSDHAPWSNGYESMIYIAWTTTLAGIIFTRSSLGGLSATAILAAVILFVAGLSWMDPEITPLVPVLKSYWLTIHVSLEAGSYGFLTLGAIIGLLNLTLMLFSNSDNREGLMVKIRELTYISEMTLMGGLVMISIGTYLGGVWANESWGRYWGWDAKETWALVTILVYAFILHQRLIPGLRGPFAFNLASLFGFFSVLMTYFGVNYYLSGLHSYAAGDPVPIPTFLYFTVGIMGIISVLAYRKYVLWLK